MNLSCRPDLLLCNSLKEEKGRILVEFENSRISDLGLLDKINHLTYRPADWILFLASSQSLLENLGRLVRKILRGECKSNRQTVFFTSTAQGCVYRNILFGLWSPSFVSDDFEKRLGDIVLYRYDNDFFDSEA